MLLFLLRHAEALDSQPDARRMLSENGHAQIAQIARVIPSKDFSGITQIEHSPYLRAVETAGILKKHALPNATLRVLPDITPNDNPLPLARELASTAAQTPRLIVGHNPHIAHLASLLLSNGHGEYFFQPATCMALERYSPADPSATFGYWRLIWHINPDLGERACAAARP
ncbi:MAG: histidine phosphatase family protein [Puniceicoccales bacterium]|nr:histidine phosphatase family protein [Puniceicoccales bacterium]